MTKDTQVTTATESFAVRVYKPTKNRLKELVLRKSQKEGRYISETELVDRYVNSGLARDERKLKSA